MWSLMMFLGACGSAAADDPAPADELEAAVAEVEKAAGGVVSGVGSGQIDLVSRGPALVMAYTRLSLGLSRLEQVAAKVAPPTPEVVVEPEAPAEAGAPVAAKEPAREPAKAASATRTEPEATETRSAAPETSSKAVESETTGIASVDAFLRDAAQVSADMASLTSRMESARGKLSSSLGLAKKFKAADAQQALAEKLGTDYKISLSPKVSVKPGADAKDPAIVSNLQSALGDLQEVQKKLPGVVERATAVARQGAEVPAKAKDELQALGPVKSVEALGKVSKAAKSVGKIPKDAKALGDEISLWTKVVGG